MRTKTNKRKGWAGLIAVLTAAVFVASFFAACNDKPIEDASVFLLDKTSIELTVNGNVEVLTLNIVNVDEVPQWKSSDTSIATVSVGSAANKATVKGVGEGVALVTATAGDKTVSCAVTVKPGMYITIENSTVNLLKGRTETIEIDTNVTGTLTYKSSDESVATVSDGGLITAVDGGTATITVSGGNVSAKCTVNVTAPAVSLDKELVQLMLEEGKNTAQLTAESNGTVEWKSENPGIATVDDNGLVTAVAVGETTVTATYESASASCVVKVKGELLTVTISPETVELTAEHASEQLTATVSPEQTGDDAAVTWSVVDGNDLVTVSESGVVTWKGGENYGTATVRATSFKDTDAYGEITVSCPDPYGDWIAISDKATLEAALSSANENKNMYLTGDIDLGGAKINSTLNAYKGIFDGRGYELINYSGKLCHALFGTVQNLALTCDASNLEDHFGAICHHVESSGTIKNCRIDMTVESGSWKNAIGCYNTGTVENTIILMRVAAGTSNNYAGCEQNNAAGKWNNVFYTAYGSGVGSNGPTVKTEAQLKTVATFDGWDTDIWAIEDGEIPVLKNGGNIGEVSVTLSAASATVHKDDTLSLVATVKPAKLPTADKAVTWTSSDDSVATVDGNGVVTALKTGTATITATSDYDDSKSASCDITVDGATEITLSSQENVSLEIGGTSKISATVNRGELEYVSDNTDAATVDELGNITALAAGTARITVSSVESPNKTVTVTVTVLPEVQISIAGEARREMEIGATLALELVTNRPDDNGAWSVSDGTVASVADGVVTALKAGTVTVTYTSAKDPKKYARVEIVVQPEIELSVVSTLTIKTGAPAKLEPNISRGGVTFGSSDDEIVTVDELGTVTGLKEGTATITVTSVIDGTKTATCQVTVSDDVQVTVTLDKTAVTLDWGEQIVLKATVNVGGVTWSVTEGDDIVAVDETGKVIALENDGTAVVTATSTEDPEVSATCTVIVEYVDPVISLYNPDNSAVEAEIGDALDIDYTISKGTATITIDGGDGIVKLEDNKLTALKAGTVTVKIVSDERESVFEQFAYTVLPAPEITITNKAQAAEGIKLGEGSLTIETSANRTDGSVSFGSSNDNIATVDEDGVVTAKAIGDVVIIATFTTELGKTATDSVTVTVYDEAILELALEARSVAVGGSYKIEPSKAAGGKITWSSSNTAVATVDADGTVRGVAVGKATVTAAIGGTKASMVIAVYEKEAGYIEVSTVEQFLGITGANKYYLVNDIDFAGTEYKEKTFGTMVATIRGQGYAVKNLTMNLSGTDVGFIDMMGNGFDMQGVNFIDMTIKGSAIHGGLMRIMDGNALIANCYFDVNMEARGIRIAPIGQLNGSSRITNCIFNVRYTGDGALSAAANANPRAAVGRQFGASKYEKLFVNSTTLGAAAGKVFAVSSGDGNTELMASAFKTEDELKASSLYDETWEQYWITVDGELPVLRGALVEEPVSVAMPATEEVAVGETVTLSVTVKPNDLPTEDKAVTWSSSDESIATVDRNGIVTGIKAGDVVITATSVKDSAKSASCTVTVKSFADPFVSITNKSEIGADIAAGADVTLVAEGNQDGEYSWSSSDTEIATVDESGKLTLIKTGTVTITVTFTAHDMTATDSVTFNVYSGAKIEIALERRSVSIGGTYVVDHKVLGGTAVWESSDESVATVAADGTVTGIAAGVAEITATVDGTDAIGSIQIHVYEKAADGIEVYDKASLVAALVGDNFRKNIYVVCDIDLEGATLNSGINEYFGTFDGMGYTISGYNGLLFHNLSGTLQNLSVVCGTAGLNNSDGALMHHVNGNGVIKNCMIDVTFVTDVTGGIACFVAGKVENTIIYARNTNGVGQAYAASVQNNMGSSSNVFYVAYGNVFAGGATLKTEAQLSSADTFDESWNEGWIISDGEKPRIRTAWDE